MNPQSVPFVSGPQIPSHVGRRVRILGKLLAMTPDGFRLVLSSGTEISVRTTSLRPSGSSIVLLVVGTLESASSLVLDQLFELGQDFDMALFEEAVKLQFRPELAAAFDGA
jgi:hypothetical protein